MKVINFYLDYFKFIKSLIKKFISVVFVFAFLDFVFKCMSLYFPNQASILFFLSLSLIFIGTYFIFKHTPSLARFFLHVKENFWHFLFVYVITTVQVMTRLLIFVIPGLWIIFQWTFVILISLIEDKSINPLTFSKKLVMANKLIVFSYHFIAITGWIFLKMFDPSSLVGLFSQSFYLASYSCFIFLLYYFLYMFCKQSLPASISLECNDPLPSMLKCLGKLALAFCLFIIVYFAAYLLSIFLLVKSQ